MLLTILFLANISNTSRKKKKVYTPSHACRSNWRSPCKHPLLDAEALLNHQAEQQKDTETPFLQTPVLHAVKLCQYLRSLQCSSWKHQELHLQGTCSSLLTASLNLHFTDVLIINSFFPCHVHAWAFSSRLVGKQKGSTYSTNSSNLSQPLSPILFLILVHQESRFLKIMRGLFFLRFLCVTVASDGNWKAK